MKRMISAIVLALLLVGGTTGCSEEGPMEKAGEKMDQAMDDVAEEGEEAKKKVEEAME